MSLGGNLRDMIARIIFKRDRASGERVERETRDSFGRMEGFAKRLGIALAAAFSVARITAFIKSSLSAAAESEAIWNRVAGAVERSGASWAGMERRVRATARALLDIAGIGDEQFGAAFDRLIGLTGDAEFSLSQMSFAADIAAKFYGGDLIPAVDLLGKAYSGNTRALRQLSIATDDVNEGLAILRERVAGAATHELNTIEGKMRQLAEVAGDAREEFGFFIFRTLGGNETAVALNRFKLGLEVIGDWFKTHRLGTITLPGGIVMPWVFPIKDGANSGGGGGGGWGGAPKPPRLPPDSAALAAADAARREAERRRMARANRDVRTTTLAGAEDIQGGLAGGFMPLFGIEEMLEQVEPKINAFWEGISNAAQNAANGVAGAWQDVFELMLSGSATVGRTMEAIARGISAAFIGGIAEVAAVESGKETAAGVGKLAAGTWPPNPAAISSALTHFKSAGLWAIVAGFAGAAQSAIGGGGRGGLSGGIPSGATDIGSRIARDSKVGAEINIFVDPFDKDNAVHQVAAGEAARRYAERYGGQIIWRSKR